MDAVRAGSLFFILLFWLSSWIPVPLDENAIVVVLGCVGAFVFASLMTGGTRASLKYAARALNWLAILLLIGGMLFAALAGALGTSVDGAIALFHSVGWAAFVLMLSEILRSGGKAKFCLGKGGAVLLMLGVWSWISAASMYFHRGLESTMSDVCILAPKRMSYSELTSIWNMRLPDVASSRTGPTGTTTLDYHAILVVPGNSPRVHNWSKTRMRFEDLDRAKNRDLPGECPQQAQ